MKVKKYVEDMAMCIKDTDESIMNIYTPAKIEITCEFECDGFCLNSAGSQCDFYDTLSNSDCDLLNKSYDNNKEVESVLKVGDRVKIVNTYDDFIGKDKYIGKKGVITDFKHDYYEVKITGHKQSTTPFRKTDLEKIG